MNKKKKKLNLDELKVQSFVTAFDIESGKTAEIKGGDHGSCGSDPCGCYYTRPLDVCDGDDTQGERYCPPHHTDCSPCAPDTSCLGGCGETCVAEC